MSTFRPYAIHGVTLQADEEGFGAFNVFNPDSEKATDRGPDGMVEEMRTFLRITAGMRRLADIGALFGIFSLMFTRDPMAQAWAFEPSPWAYPHLLDHLFANPDHAITPMQVFIGEETGRRVACGRDWKHVVAHRPDSEQVSVEEHRLDDLAIGPIDAMKIDTEGYEVAVLRGAQEVIQRDRPVIFLEAHVRSLPSMGESAETLMTALRDLNYKPYQYDGTPVEDFAAYAMTRVICRPA